MSESMSASVGEGGVSNLEEEVENPISFSLIANEINAFDAEAKEGLVQKERALAKRHEKICGYFLIGAGASWLTSATALTVSGIMDEGMPQKIAELTNQFFGTASAPLLAIGILAGLASIDCEKKGYLDRRLQKIVENTLNDLKKRFPERYEEYLEKLKQIFETKNKSATLQLILEKSPDLISRQPKTRN